MSNFAAALLRFTNATTPAKSKVKPHQYDIAPGLCSATIIS